ncbi:MAG: hypothetical protein M3373_12950 [Gemmatimonadota bacterium]|nr:hypothetical protein [Gemmatimonadota bacterium]
MSDTQLDLLSRDELPKRDTGLALAHLAECAECASRRQRLAADEREIGSALRLLDHPVPELDVGVVLRRARRRRRQAHLWRLAAAFTALATAGVATAMPGSPIREWLDRARANEQSGPQSTAETRTAGEPGASSGLGISVGVPDSVVLVFEAAQEDGSIRITFSAGNELRVRAIGGSAGFAVRSGGVLVRNRGSTASYDVGVPASATSVNIRVGDRPVFAKRGSAIAIAPRPEPDGSYLATLRPATTRP